MKNEENYRLHNELVKSSKKDGIGAGTMAVAAIPAVLMTGGVIAAGNAVEHYFPPESEGVRPKEAPAPMTVEQKEAYLEAQLEGWKVKIPTHEEIVAVMDKLHEQSQEQVEEK